MDRPDLIQRLMATFLGELQELVRDLERDLLRLEPSHDPAERAELLGSLFRSAHSLKGAARSVGMQPIEAACHRLEDLFASLRDGERETDAELFKLLFAVVDALADAGARLKRGEDASGGALGTLLAKLDLGAPATPATGAAGAAPVAPDAPPEALPTEVPTRIAANKLDTLLEQGSELLLARSGTRAVGEEFADLQARLAEAKREARALLQTVSRLAPPPQGSVGSPRLARPADPAGEARAIADTFAGLEKSLNTLAANYAASRRAIDHAAAPLEAEIRTIHMQPFSHACEGLDRVIRDLTSNGRKSARLAVEGGEIAVDRAIIEGLRSPLRHLVRNAIDHGVETVKERRAAGKPDSSLITIAARLAGDRVMLSVADDGRGLQLEAIREAAARAGLPDPGEAEAQARHVFEPGVSTSAKVTSISGRGVGLDAVRSAVEALRGDISVASTAGEGTCFSIRLPLTVTTTRALLVACAGQTFAIESLHVRQLLRVADEDFSQLHGRRVLRREHGAVSVVDVASWLGLGKGAPAPSSRRSAVLLGTQEEIALLVDEFLTEEELVIRSLGARLQGMEQFAGAAVLPNGRFALVLNPVAVGKDLNRSAMTSSIDTAPPLAKRRLLVVDDSITTRTLEQSTLAAAGFEVITACDGAEAWDLLRSKGADLVVTDIEMPRMDGIALTVAIRQSPELRSLPVILVTARDSEEDKLRGLEAGADAYLVKSAFDQQLLLDAVARLL